jgi:hypothetical protein
MSSFCCIPGARWWRVFASLLLVGLPLAVEAKEIRVEAKLVWGTNDEKSPKKEHVPVDKMTAEKLRKVFKWKNYFVENRVVGTIPSRGSNLFKLSPQCTIEITELEGPKVEVKLVGNGKAVHRMVKDLNKGEWFVYSGDDKNECAWFAIITQLDEK